MNKSVLFTGPYAKDWLVGLLKEDTVLVTFVKSSGEERVMKCTLKESVVPHYEKKTEKAKATNDSVVSVWDIEINEWRSFRLDSIKTIEFGVL